MQNSIIHPIPFLLLMGMLLVSQQLFAQKPKEEDNACVLNLEQSNEYYRQGKIELITEQLLPCLKGNRLNKENTIRAYRLLTITQLYFNEPDSAAIFMGKLLKLEPEYELNNNLDPTEFIQLYNAFRTTPILILGLEAGGNYTFVQNLRNYSLDGTAPAAGTYTPELGYAVKLGIEIPVNKWIAIATGSAFQYNRYSLERRQFNYSQLSYEEELSWLSIPLEAKFYFSEGDFRPHFSIGAAFQYLLSANATLERLDSLNEELGNQTVSGPAIDRKNQRASFHIPLRASVGFMWKNVIGNGFLTARISYEYGLRNLVRPSSRYDNPTLLYDYTYVDNNFATQCLSVEIGYAIPIYKPKLKKNKR